MNERPESSELPGAVLSRDPEVHGGDLVFAGTRVPVENLVDYLKGGSTVEEFLEDFPSVERRQVEAFLDLALSDADRLREPRARPA